MLPKRLTALELPSSRPAIIEFFFFFFTNIPFKKKPVDSSIVKLLEENLV